MTGSNQVRLVSAKGYLHVVENLFHYYVYELAAMGRWPCNADGVYIFNSALPEPHWQRDDHWPYLIYQGDELAGFCLLRRYPVNCERYDIDQFFIIRKFMGTGVGKAALNLAVKQFPGRWQTRVMLENLPGLKFWRAVISSLTQGAFQERILTDENLQMHFITYEVYEQ